MLMDDDTAAILSVICRDYRDCHVPPSHGTPEEWADPEQANRWFVAIGLAGDNALFRGASRIKEHVDALCRVAAVEEVRLLAKHALLEDLAPRVLGMLAPDVEAELVPHLQWLVAVVNGRAGDITSLWTGREPQDAFESLKRLYKSDIPAYVVIRAVTGVRSHASISPDALAAATRLGIVSWTESVLDEHGGFEALRRVFEDYGDDSAWEALEWFSRIQCNEFSQRCVTCAVNMDCQALALGTV